MAALETMVNFFSKSKEAFQNLLEAMSVVEEERATQNQVAQSPDEVYVNKVIMPVWKEYYDTSTGYPVDKEKYKTVDDYGKYYAANKGYAWHPEIYERFTNSVNEEYRSGGLQ